MSYILEALRKSDQQRQRGAAPTLLTAQASATAVKQPAFWLYGLLAAVLLGAGVAIGWLRPWEPLQPAPLTPAAAAHPLQSGTRLPASPRAESARTPQAEPQLSASAPAAEPVPAPARVSLKPAVPARAETAPRSVPSVAPAAHSANSAVAMPEQPAASVTTAAPVVIPLAELPAALQQELPALTVSVHAYSGKPAERLVGINNRLLREGDEVASGLKLEQITPDGMILSYKGVTFRRGVK